MTNHRLRGAMLGAGVSATELASAAGVDPKSVSRWLCEDRLPHAQTRHKVAGALGQQEAFLWPELLSAFEPEKSVLTELARVWARRTAITADSWHGYFNRAAKQIDILVYAGGFLVEVLDLADIIRWKSASGVQVRILVGDPDSAAVHTRAQEEGVIWLPERCRTMARYLAGLSGVSGATVRVHGTTLYASIFRFDDLLLVNQHVYGSWACHSPVLEVLRSAGSTHLFDYYSSAYERVWGVSQPGPT